MNVREIVLGIAIGDAFGAGVEFMDRDWIRTHVDFSAFINARHLIKADLSEPDIFTKNYTPWDYTDDTEMTIGIIKALLSGKEFSTDLLIECWTREYEDGYARKGYGRNGHGSMRWVFSGKKTIEEVRDFQRQTLFPGNAPVMRVVPLGFVPEPLINTYATINAEATHPHPKAIAASILVARATEYMLVRKGESQSIIPYCLAHIINMDEATEQVLAAVDQLPPPAALPSEAYTILCGPQPIQAPLFLPGIKGVPSDAMHTAACILYLLKHSTDTLEGLRNAVYLGGDVDSVASVCTGILAGRYGLAYLPAFMIDGVEGNQALAKLANDFTHYLKALR